MVRQSYLLLVCLFFAAVFSHAGHDHEEENVNSDVRVLGDEDFDKTVADNQFVFAEFYAPWCGHCKSLAPEYEKVATHFKDSNIIIAKIDATVASEVAAKNDVRGYPTLKFFRNGKPIDYDGGRSSVEIIQWITKKTSPPSTELKSDEEVKKFLEQKGVKIIGYVLGENVNVFVSAASGDGMDDFLFGHVTDKALFGENADNSIVIQKPEESPLVYSGEFTEKKIEEFVMAEGFPLFEELAQKIWTRSASTESPLLAVFVDSASEENLALTREIAQKYKGKVLSSYSTAAALADRWGTSGKVFPTAVMVIWKGQEPKLVVFDEESGAFNVESGIDFVEKALNSEYKSYRKSQPIPESNDGPVTVLVGKNFEQIVFDSEKDVFVEFYAPWCGHCKNLAPVWDELGKAFADVPTLVIAKMDATANSYPESVEIRGFPTLLFFAADNKEPVTYTGDRDLESLKAFVKEEASRPVEKEEL